jgi:hypothetical protein
VNITNTLAYTFIGTGGGNGNTSGLCSYSNGSGKITMDLSRYGTQAAPLYALQTAAWTSDANIPALVDKLSDLLTGGMMSASAKAQIVSYVTYQRPISAIATGNPCTITTGSAHGLSTGDTVTISGVTGGIFSPAINGTFTVTVTGANTFTVGSNFSNSSGLSLAAAIAPNLPYTASAPTATQMRDRVRAVVHLIVTSAEYAIQK